eukprot:821680-Rhodomonas_salina.1
MSFWYRHRKECFDPNNACGLYLFAAYSNASKSKCWALWLENSKVWYDNTDRDPAVLFANQRCVCVERRETRRERKREA